MMTTTTDLRPHLTRALATARTAITAVRNDDVHRPTPCDDYDVEALVAHLLGVAHRIDAVGRGLPVFALPGMITGVELAGWRLPGTPPSPRSMPPGQTTPA
jgi:hypothetical protein